MKLRAQVLSIILVASGVVGATQQTSQRKPVAAIDSSVVEKKAWASLKERFTKYSNYLSGNIWSLIHTYESKTEMERALKVFESIAVTLASDDPASMNKFDGPTGFKSQLVQLMKSKDDTVSGFGAVVLAIIGDMNYAPQIASLLTRNNDLPPDTHPPITVRARAAVALGLMGAKKYTEQIVLLLQSENDYDRSGAAIALGYLKATEHANDVASLLLRKDKGIRNDESVIDSLVEMGVAANYKKEIARLLHDEIPGDAAKKAAYALARLDAKEHAQDIAKLLKHEYQGRHAARALALLGAKEYAKEIAPLLVDKNSFNRESAALALGILNARDHAPAVAKLLKDEEPWVSRAAALGLVLMEAREYAAAALPIIAEQKSETYFDAGDFDELVIEQVNQLETRFRASLARMKGVK